MTSPDAGLIILIGKNIISGFGKEFSKRSANCLNALPRFSAYLD
jgi:hypothetical protein